MNKKYVLIAILPFILIFSAMNSVCAKNIKIIINSTTKEINNFFNKG